MKIKYNMFNSIYLLVISYPTSEMYSSPTERPVLKIILNNITMYDYIYLYIYLNNKVKPVSF